MSKDCKSNHGTRMNDHVAESFLSTFIWIFTAFSFFTVFKSKNLFLFIYKHLLKNNIRNLKWSSKLKTKRKKMRSEDLVFCKMTVLHNC